MRCWFVACHATDQDSQDDICSRYVQSGFVPHTHTDDKCQTQNSVFSESPGGGGLPLAQEMASVLALPGMFVEIQRSIFQIAPVTDARCRCPLLMPDVRGPQF